MCADRLSFWILLITKFVGFNRDLQCASFLKYRNLYRAKQMALYAMSQTYTKEAFIKYMELHGYKVQWEDGLKYITFITPDNHICRDKNLFDESSLLKDNMEVYRPQFSANDITEKFP